VCLLSRIQKLDLGCALAVCVFLSARYKSESSEIT
jgi:hypothetical protein